MLISVLGDALVCGDKSDEADKSDDLPPFPNPCLSGVWSARPRFRPLPYQGYMRLNPCFNGIWSARSASKTIRRAARGLNPCFNGIWSARELHMLQLRANYGS